MTVADLNLIEAKRGLCRPAIAVNRHFGWDMGIVNVNGGAIALGHHRGQRRPYPDTPDV
jgi:acetyl-CoA C-acetyltransferase